MTAPRILILTASHLCRNPRVVKEATTLGQAGYDVTVLNVSSVPAFERLDAAIRAGRPFRQVCIDNIGTSPWRRAGALHRRTGVWLARKLARYTPYRPVTSLGPAGALLRAARGIQSDLTIVHTELPAWIGTRLLRAGRRVAADIEDWYSEDLLPEARRFLPLRQLRHVERTLLHESIFTTTTSDALAAALHETYGGRRPDVILNAFPLPPLQPALVTDRPIRFVWFSQTIGPGRGLEAFIAAWAQLALPTEVSLIGECSADYRGRLLSSLSAEQSRRFTFPGLVAAEELPARLATCDIGLALEPRTPRNKDLTISNKILQYLGSGLAVVASNTAGQREVMAHATGAGPLVETSDTAAFAASLSALAGDRSALARARRAARTAAEQHYCWEREASRLLALVAGVLAPAR